MPKKHKPEQVKPVTGNVYLSTRGIALVYQGRQGSLRKTMLTVESYIKWYDIFTVSRRGVISKLPYKYTLEYQKAFEGFVAWSDHLPNIHFCLWLAQAYPQYEWDEPSLDMIYGRWIRENRPTLDPTIHKLTTDWLDIYEGRK